MEKMTNTSANIVIIVKYFRLLLLITLLGLAKDYLIAKVVGVCIGILLLIILTVHDWQNRDNSTNYVRVEYFLSMALINFILYWYILHEIFIMWALSWTGLALATTVAHFGRVTTHEE